MKQDRIKEQLTIGNSIISHLNNEVNTNVKQLAIARFEVQINNNEIKQFWVVRNEIGRSHSYIRDFNGNVINTERGISSVYKHDGDVISRESPFFGTMRQWKVNKEYTLNNFNYKLISFSDYFPLIDTQINAINGSIITIKDKKQKRNRLEFASIITELARLQEEYSKLKDPKEKAKKKQEINFKLQEIEKESERKKRHYNERVDFLEKPVLDAEQDKIRRKNVLNGSLIINGGPGTGKTVALIQRITLLTSSEIQDELNLSDKELKILKESWCFFSPSQRLGNFLKDAMVREELKPTIDNILVWETAKHNLLSNSYYSVLGTNNFKNISGAKNIYALSKPLKDFEEDFEMFYCEFHTKKIQKIVELKTDIVNLKWKEYGKRVIKYCEEVKPFHSFSDIIKFYNNLENNIKEIDNPKTEKEKQYNKHFFNPIKKIKENYNIIINKYLNYLKKYDKEKYDQLLKKTNRSKIKGEEDIRLLQYVKLAIERYLIGVWDKDKLNVQIYTEIKELYKKGFNGYNLFTKTIEPLVLGISTNFLQNIPEAFKQYRETPFYYEQIKKEHKSFFKEVVLTKNQITNDEKDFILLLILNASKKLQKENEYYFNNTNDKYITAYKNYTKRVIAIDEATDFSIIELACMRALSHHKYNSVSLVGDLAQRFTANGIKAWSNYSDYTNEQNIVENLEISYRQNKTLSDISIKFYEKINPNDEITFKPHFDDNTYDPKPLYFVSDDDDEKVSWIVNRILEIRENCNGHIPSIAVFVKEDLQKYGKKFLENDIVIENGFGISVCFGEDDLGEAGKIRLFDIKYIKGLEFEALFFLDTDEILKHSGMNQYLYVGISRAYSYVGLTCKNELPEILSDMDFEKANEEETYW